MTTTTVRCACGAEIEGWHPTHVVAGEEVVLIADDVMEDDGQDRGDLIGSVGAYSLHKWHVDSFPAIRRTVDGRWLRDMGDRIDDDSDHVVAL